VISPKLALVESDIVGDDRQRHTAGMGFDPTRKHKASPFDYVFVASAFIVVIALVAWAALA
jgi:hypothetical protein